MTWLQPEPPPNNADTNQLQQRIEAALQTRDPPAALTQLVRQFFAEGFSEGQALGVLESVRAQLRLQQRTHEEEVIMDVIDLVVGWCSPDARLRREP